MKQAMKRAFSIVCVLAMLLSAFAVFPISASAEEVVPRALIRQNLAKWKNYTYGDPVNGTLYRTGCGMFAIVNAVGYLTGNEMSVTEVASWGHAIGGYNPGSSHAGTYRMTIYPRLQAKYGAQYGFTVNCGSSNEGFWGTSSNSTLKNHLKNGGVAIGHVPGHFIALVGYDSTSNLYHVYDSYPTNARGTGTGDCWKSPSALATGKLKLDWFCLLSRDPNGPINLDYGEEPGSSSKADKIGTYAITASASDPLNVRESASSSATIVDTVQEGDIVYVSELNGNWGKFKTPDGIEGWAAIKNYSTYIGVDVQSSTGAPAWGEITTSIDTKGCTTLTNNSSEQAAYDYKLPIQIGTETTQYFATQITLLSGSGYYFGLTEQGSGVWAMRDCNSSDQLVGATTAGYMTNIETLEIDLDTWWTKIAPDNRIDCVRIYLAPNTSIKINYMYMAAGASVVVNEKYNLNAVGQMSLNENLMDPYNLTITDNSKTGSFSYNDGRLTIVSEETDLYEVTFNINRQFSPEMYHRWLVSFESNVRYDVDMVVTTTEGDRTISLVSDYWPAMVSALDGDYIPCTGATQSWGLDLYSFYTYNNNLDASGLSVIKSITIQLGGKGTMHVNHLQIANEDVLLGYYDGISVSGSSPNGDIVTDEPVTDDPVEGLVGDVNDDLTVSTLDARELLKYATGLVTFTDKQLLFSDFNGDGLINTADAREILISTLA